MQAFSVKIHTWVGEKDGKLNKIAVSSLKVIKEGISWSEAKALVKANPGAEIFHQTIVEVTK